MGDSSTGKLECFFPLQSSKIKDKDMMLPMMHLCCNVGNFVKAVRFAMKLNGYFGKKMISD